MTNDSNGKKTPLWKRKALVLPACVLIFVGLRGIILARLISGRYSLSSFAVDAAAGIVLVTLLQFLDELLKEKLSSAIGANSLARRLATRAIRLPVLVLVFGTFLLATIQMHPARIGCAETPAAFGMDYEAHEVQTDDGVRISAWTIPSKDTQRPVVVVTHGLGANKQNFLHVSSLIHKLNYNVVAFDFRSHGDSGGHTCSLGVHEARDVKAAFDLAQSQFPDRPVYAWSTSLGAAATLRAAAHYQIFDKLVVDASFSSVKNLAMETKFCYFGPLATPAWNISRLWFAAYAHADIENYAPEDDIAEITCPIFLIHGERDPMIPPSELERLKSAAKARTISWLAPGAGHSASFQHPDCPRRLADFYDNFQ